MMTKDWVAHAAQVLWRAIRRAVALIVGWGLGIALLLVTAQTLAPGEIADWIRLAQGVTVAVLVLVALYVCVAGWVRNVPEERCRLKVENAALEALTRDFRIRGRLCRVAAAGLFLAMTTIALAGIYVFGMVAWSRSQYHESLPLRLSSLVEPLRGAVEPESLLTDPNAVAFLQYLLDHGSHVAWNEAIGPLFLLFFVLRVTGALYGYMVRLGAFYESRADYLQFGGPTEGLSIDEVLRFVDTTVVTNDTWLKKVMDATGRTRTKSEGDSPQWRRINERHGMKEGDATSERSGGSSVQGLVGESPC